MSNPEIITKTGHIFQLKPQPLSHKQEMINRKARRAVRTPSNNHRTRTIIQIIDGQVHPSRRITLWNGIRIRADGTPRSRSYKAAYSLPLNAAGKPRR